MAPSLRLVLRRGFLGNCPACGIGKLFERKFVLNEKCSNCSCSLKAREDDTYFFMYLSAGFITGVLLIGLFFIVPTNIMIGRVLLLLFALFLYFKSWPYRKGLATALDYYIDTKTENPRHPLGPKS